MIDFESLISSGWTAIAGSGLLAVISQMIGSYNG